MGAWEKGRAERFATHGAVIASTTLRKVVRSAMTVIKPIGFWGEPLQNAALGGRL